MKKEYTLKKKRNFDFIITNEKPIKYKEFVVFYKKTEDMTYHFGISVGKKIGNAVVRNKIKRQIRQIIDKNNYKINFNCIIIVGRGVLNCTYQKMEEDLIVALKRLNIIEENNENE